MKPAFRVFAITAIIACAGIASLWLPRGTSTAAAVLALRLPDTQGIEQDMARWRGKIIVANYWATWCPPCRTEIPDFSAAAREFTAAPVQFVGISIDMADKVQSFAREHEVAYPLLIAPRQALDETVNFGNTARVLPFTLIIDRHGVARHRHIGLTARDTLEKQIRELLAETP